MKFKEIVQSQRQAFDRIEQTPVDSMWAGIDQRLHKRSRKRMMLWIGSAAAVIACLAIPATILLNRAGEEPFVERQLTQYEQQYARMTSERIGTLETDILDPDVYADLMRELSEVDQMYAELKSDITNVPDAEQLIETAIRFHERKLRILELLAKEIEHEKRNQQYNAEIKI